MEKLNRSQQTKQKILLAAFALLKENGVKSLSAANIAKNAGISKSSFFHHFNQIEDFYLYILDSIIESFNQQAEQHRFDNLEQFIRFSTRFVFDFIDQSPEVFTAVHSFLDQFRNNPKTLKHFTNMVEQNIAKWSHDLAHFFPQDFDRQQIERLSYLLDIFVIGLSNHYIIMNNRSRYEQVSEDFIAMMLSYLEHQNENKKTL